MNWNNLKKNKCPKCGKDLADKLIGDYFHCGCGFVISAKKFRELVNKVGYGSRFDSESHYRPDDEVPDIDP